MAIYFVLVYALIHEVSTRAANVVLVLYALELGASPVAIGALAAMFSLFPMLLAVQAGRLADRFGTRGLMILGTGVGAVGMLLAAVVHGLPIIFIAAALMGFQGAMMNVCLQNAVGLLSTPETRARNFSNYSLASSASNLIGPLIAGFSIDVSGHSIACLYVVALSATALVLVALRREPLPGGTRSKAKATGGIGSMLKDPAVRRTLATSSLQVAGNHLYQFYMPVYAHSIGLAPSVIGIVLSMNAAAAVVVRAFMPRLLHRYKEEAVLAYALYFGAASLLLLPLFTSSIMLGLLSFVFGLGMGCSGPIVTMLMFTNSADGRSAEGVGLKIASNHLTKVVSPVVFGAVASALGLYAIFWINAFMLGTGGFASRPRGKNTR